MRVITPGLACLAMLVSSTGCLLSFPPPPGGGDGGTDDSGTCPACRRCVWRNVVVQAAGAPVARPSIDRGPGDALGVAWQLGALPEDVWGATFDASGTASGSRVNVSASANPSVAPSIAAAPSGFVVAWRESEMLSGDGGGDIRVAALDTGGAVGWSAQTTDVGDGSAEMPDVTFNGDALGLVWTDFRDFCIRVFATAADETSGVSPVPPGYRTTTQTCDGSSGPPAAFPSIAAASGGFGVAWEDTREGGERIYFTRLGADGQAITAETRESALPGPSRAPALASNGSLSIPFGLAWTDEAADDDAIFFATVDIGGGMGGTPLRMTDGVPSGEAAVTWSRVDWALAWRDPNGIAVARVRADGTAVVMSARVPETGGGSDQPAVAATEDRIAVVWREGGQAVNLAICTETAP